MEISPISMYDLLLSEDKLSGNVGHGNSEYIQIKSGREINEDGSNFNQGPIDFSYDLQSNQYYDSHSAFIRFQVSLTKPFPVYNQLVPGDDVAPAMNSGSLLISQLYLYYNETLIDEIDADTITYVDMINHRQNYTRDALNFYKEQSNNNMSSNFYTRQKAVVFDALNPNEYSFTSQSIIYRIPLATFQKAQSLSAHGKWRLQIIPNQNYKKDYVQSLLADRVPGTHYDVRVTAVEMYVKVIEGPRLSNSTFYINNTRYSKQTQKVQINGTNTNMATFFVPKNTYRIGAFFRYNGVQDTRFPKSNFTMLNGGQNFLRKFVIKYKGKYEPPLDMLQTYEANGFNGLNQMYKFVYSLKDYEEFTPEAIEDYTARGPYILSDFDENSMISSNEAHVYYEFSQVVTDVELVLIFYTRKQFRVIIQNDQVTRIDDTSDLKHVKDNVPKDGFTNEINRPKYLEDDLKGREVDFDQLSLLDLKNSGIKVQLSEKTIQDLINVNIPDPSDTTYRIEGRPQRTVKLSVNLATLAQSTLPVGVKVDAIRQALNSNHAETVEEIQNLSSAIVGVLNNQAEYQQVNSNRAYLDVINNTINNALNIPSVPELFGFYKQYYTIQEFTQNYSSFYLFLQSNIPMGRNQDKPMVIRSSDSRPQLMSLLEIRGLDPTQWVVNVRDRTVERINNSIRSLMSLAQDVAYPEGQPSDVNAVSQAPPVPVGSSVPPPPPPPPMPSRTNNTSGFQSELTNAIMNPNLRPTVTRPSQIEDSRTAFKRELDARMEQVRARLEGGPVPRENVRQVREIVREIVSEVPTTNTQENREIVRSMVNNILNAVVANNEPSEAISEIESVISEVVSEIPGVSPDTTQEIIQSATSSIVNSFTPVSTRDILNASRKGKEKVTEASPSTQDKMITIQPRSIAKQKENAKERIKELIKLSNETTDVDEKDMYGQEIDSIRYKIDNNIWDDKPIRVSEYLYNIVKNIEHTLRMELQKMQTSKDIGTIVDSFENSLKTIKENSPQIKYSVPDEVKENYKIIYNQIRTQATNLYDNLKDKQLTGNNKKQFDRLDNLLVYGYSTTGSGKKKSKKLSLRY